MSAGIYAARKKLKTLLVAEILGGQMADASHIDNYLGYESILGVELAQKFAKHLKNFKEDIEIKEGELVAEIKKIEKTEDGKPAFEVITENNRWQAKTILITSGKMARKLEAPGEEKFSGKGVAYCATCDAPLFKDKIVAVVGAGNSGLGAALQLTAYAKKIYLINKYPSLEKGDETYREKIKVSPLVTIFNNTQIKEIKGDKFVKSIILQNTADNTQQEIKVEGVFVEIGSIPNLQFAKHLVEYNSKGEIEINFETNATSCLGIFAAGDVTNIPYKQIIISAGEGAKAALSVYHYLTGMQTAVRGA